jgi:DNA-binding transcriptional ArsR family regulator
MTPTRKQMAARRASLRPHAVRDQIVDVMRSYGRPISPTQLARVTGGTLGSVAYHVRTLAAAGVIELADEGRVRGAVEHYYALTAATEEEGPLVDPLGALLSLCGAMTVAGEDGDYPRRVVLDDAGRQELRALITQLRPKVQAIASAATARTEPTG